jgi:hypothetical protein
LVDAQGRSADTRCSTGVNHAAGELGINGSAMQGPMVVPNKSFSEIDDEKYDR